MHTRFCPPALHHRILHRLLPAAAALVIVAAGALSARADDAAKPFLGGWDLTLPGGGAGWLGVSAKDGQLKADLLWGGGSVLPVQGVKVEGDRSSSRRPARSRAKTSRENDQRPATKTITGRLSATRLS